ncbi:hypothetical protein ABZ438_07895 [Streptomyces sp. NPDC005786]|uniref:hypothetical protein n=1 Tax=Streptomyces sp. NPDC005786 TaxID=3154891 RepID=UPI0033F8FDF4
MRPITGTDIIDHYNSRDGGILSLSTNGDFVSINAAWITEGIPYAYAYVTTDDGEYQTLLSASTITDCDWYPDALDDNGKLIPAVADEMAAIINQDGLLAGRVEKTLQTTKEWEAAVETANQLAQERAANVAEVVAYCGGSQTKAARALGLDQSTVNKLVAKNRRADAAASA